MTDDEHERALAAQRRAAVRARMQRIISSLGAAEEIAQPELGPGSARLSPAEHWGGNRPALPRDLLGPAPASAPHKPTGPASQVIPLSILGPPASEPPPATVVPVADEPAAQVEMATTVESGPATELGRLNEPTAAEPVAGESAAAETRLEAEAEWPSVPAIAEPALKTDLPTGEQGTRFAPAARRSAVADRVLLTIEVVAVIGLLATVILSLSDLRRLQRDLFGPPRPSPTMPKTAGPVARAVASTTAQPIAAASQTPANTALAPAGSQVPTTPQAALATGQPTRVALPPAPGATATEPVVTPAPTVTPGATPDSPTGVRFVIPVIGVDAPMVEGDDWDTLKEGIGHRIGSAWPGQAGNVVVSAHNDVYGAIFKNLRSLKPGDLVLAYTPTGVFTYKVLFTRLVLPNEVSVLNQTRQPILTMITCYPPFMDTHRIVVTAQLVP